MAPIQWWHPSGRAARELLSLNILGINVPNRPNFCLNARGYRIGRRVAPLCRKRVGTCPDDGALSATIHTECSFLISKINKRILAVSGESRHTMLRFGLRQSNCVSKTIRQGRYYRCIDARIKTTGTLQEYHTRAAMVGIAAANEVVVQASLGEITPERESWLLSVTSSPSSLGYDVT